MVSVDRWVNGERSRIVERNKNGDHIGSPLKNEERLFSFAVLW